MPAAPEPIDDCAVIELRQYRLHSGRRDALIELFEREFVEPQEAVGIRLLGLFRDLDDADRFVWLRGFANMAQRAAALAAFYGGPVWQAHRDAANATMIDSDDVRLLRPAWPGAGLRLGGSGGGAAVVQVVPLARPADAAFLRRVAGQLPRLAEKGIQVAGCYVSETAANTFPRLPVREGEPVFVWLARIDDAAPVAAPVLEWPGLAGPIETRRLQPTTRSRFTV